MKKCLLFFLSTAIIFNCNAQWSSDPAVNNAICTATGTQSEPQLISDGSGGAIITWVDWRSGNYDIYAQRINASGTVQWTVDGVPVCIVSIYTEQLHLISDGFGGAIITWYDNRDPDFPDIYAQRISASGIVQWTLDGVPVCTATGSQYFPQLISDGAGGAIITWEDYRNGTNSDIYSQRINASGALQWTAGGVVVCSVSADQNSPKLISDGVGGAIITWYDERYSNGDIYSQRINSAGAVQWLTNGVVICTNPNLQQHPDLISDDSGGAIITWQDNRPGDGPDIYTQHINASGAVQWTANGLAICSATGEQVYPDLISDGSGGAIVTWEDNRNGNSSDIYTQRIDANGAVQWTVDGVAVCTAIYDQFHPILISDGAGGAIVTWPDYRIDPKDIYAQRVNASGVVQWTANGVVLCSGLGNQEVCDLITDNSGGAIIIFMDDRSGFNYDIYAQNICADGNLGICSVGINEEENNSLNIYPNPATTELTITGYTPAYLKLYNTLGQIVAEANKSNKLYVGNLPQGLYVLQVFDEKGLVVKTEKVVVGK